MTLERLLIIVPFFLGLSNMLLSAWVFDRLPRANKDVPSLMFLVVLAPGLTMSLAAMGAWSSRLRDHCTLRGRSILAWTVALLTGLHLVVLSTLSSRGQRTAHLVALLITAYFLGLAPLVRRLEFQSPFGIRTRATLADEDLWRRVHTVLAVLLTFAGGCGLLGVAFETPLRLAVSVIPGAIALTATILYAAIPRKLSDRRSPE